MRTDRQTDTDRSTCRDRQRQTEAHAETQRQAGKPPDKHRLAWPSYQYKIQTQQAKSPVQLQATRKGKGQHAFQSRSHP